MLVLSRKLHESIMIGDVEVKVLSWSDNRVRLGIIAPADVNIRRSEVPPLDEKKEGE